MNSYPLKRLNWQIMRREAKTSLQRLVVWERATVGGEEEERRDKEKSEEKRAEKRREMRGKRKNEGIGHQPMDAIKGE